MKNKQRQIPEELCYEVGDAAELTFLCKTHTKTNDDLPKISLKIRNKKFKEENKKQMQLRKAVSEEK